MGKAFLKRVLHETPKDIFFRFLILNYLGKKNLHLARDRGPRMAVYANDWIGLSIYLDGVYEKEEIKDIFCLFDLLGIDPGTVSAIDAGANIGNHAIEFSKKFRRVFAFEPNPHSVKLLRFNSEFRPNIKVFDVGLSDRAETLVMSEDVANYGNSSAVNIGDGNSSVEIRVMPLDQVAEDFGVVKLIKLDVEGMESRALNGALRVIEEHQPIIVFEQHHADFLVQGEESEAIHLLRRRGYQMCLVEDRRGGRAWFWRRLINMCEMFCGRRVVRRFVLSPKVPCGSYPMIIGLPKIHVQRILGMVD